MGPGNHIFDKTGEIPVFLECLEAPAKKVVRSVSKKCYIHQYPRIPGTSSVTAPMCSPPVTVTVSPASCGPSHGRTGTPGA